MNSCVCHQLDVLTNLIPQRSPLWGHTCTPVGTLHARSLECKACLQLGCGLSVLPHSPIWLVDHRRTLWLVILLLFSLLFILLLLLLLYIYFFSVFLPTIILFMLPFRQQIIAASGVPDAFHLGQWPLGTFNPVVISCGHNHQLKQFF